MFPELAATQIEVVAQELRSLLVGANVPEARVA
jgi:hypothetical protein